MEDRARLPEAARQDFRDALEGLGLTPEQARYITWLERTGDQPTLNAIADVIRTARAECPPLVGTAEIATMLGVSRARVVQLAHLDDFPPVVMRVQATPLRLRSDVEEWRKTWSRATGRPTRTRISAHQYENLLNSTTGPIRALIRLQGEAGLRLAEALAALTTPLEGGPGRWQLPIDGRLIPIGDSLAAELAFIQRTHPGSRRPHQDYTRELRTLLPEGTVPHDLRRLALGRMAAEDLG